MMNFLSPNDNISILMVLLIETKISEVMIKFEYVAPKKETLASFNFKRYTYSKIKRSNVFNGVFFLLEFFVSFFLETKNTGELSGLYGLNEIIIFI